jgi:ABC-type nitrate/sulfonate/bicarbonate transport system substrate-binding protein
VGVNVIHRLIGLTLIVMLLVAGTPVSGQTLVTVRVVGPGNDGYTPVFYGVKAGIFRKYGLDVQTSMIANGAAAAAALSGGSADIAFTNTAVVIAAHAHNIPLQYLAPGGLTTPKGGLSKALVLKDSPLANARDLNGKTIASSALHDINSAIFLAWVDKAGGNSKSLLQIEVPASTGVAILAEHRADVVILTEPAASAALASGQVREFASPYSVLTTFVDAAGFAVLASTVDANRDVYERFAKAMHEASAFTNTHPNDTVDIAASFTGATPDAIRHGKRSLSADYLDPRNLQPLIDISAKYGLINKGFPAAEIISPAAVRPN